MGLDWSSIPPKKGPGWAGAISDEKRISIITKSVIEFKSKGLTREQVAFGIATMRVESGFNPAAKGKSTTERGLGQMSDSTWAWAVKLYNENRGINESKIDPIKDRADSEAQIKVTCTWIEKVWPEASRVSSDARLNEFTIPEIAYGMWHEGFGTEGNVKKVSKFLKDNPNTLSDFNETYGMAWLINYSYEHRSGNLPQRSDVLTADTLQKIMDVIVPGMVNSSGGGETLRREGNHVWRIKPDGGTRGYFES